MSPAAWELFDGDTGTSKYMVSVDKTGFTDSDWAVSGTITTINDTPFDATLTGVADSLSGFGAIAVDCGVSFPYLLAAGDELECSYASALPDGSSRTNTATISTDPDGIVGGDAVDAAVTFGEPTSEVDAEVNVTDSNGLSWGPVGDDASWTYEVTFLCGRDEGSHANIATIVETGQSDDAGVTVSCYDLDVTKNATTTFDRTWTWTLDKVGDQSELLLSPGQTFAVNYEVQVDASSSDSDWAVSGDIWIANNHPSRAANLTGVADSVDGIAGTVDCPALVVPAGGSLHCTYSADLPSGADRTNTATATLQNVAIASDGTVTPTGTSDVSGTYPVVFGEPTNELDECIDVEDSLAGALGTVCAADAPASFTYLYTVGPYSAPDECGENRVDNTASFTTNDHSATGEDSWTVIINVPCDEGCTLTPGYWKTHSDYGPAPYDDTWAQLPVGPVRTRRSSSSGQTFYQVLWTAAEEGQRLLHPGPRLHRGDAELPRRCLGAAGGAGRLEPGDGAVRDVDAGRRSAPSRATSRRGRTSCRTPACSTTTTTASSVRDTAPRTASRRPDRRLHHRPPRAVLPWAVRSFSRAHRPSFLAAVGGRLLGRLAPAKADPPQHPARVDRRMDPAGGG